MQPSEQALVHTRTLEGPLDVHPSKNAIVVHYDVEAYITTEYGEPIVADRKECKKIVNVSGLMASSNVTTIAKQLIAQCNLIQPSRLPELEQLLMYLQKRKLDKKDTSSATASLGNSQPLPTDDEEKADMTELDSYLELLYDDLQAKIRGTGLILQLARNPDNLNELSSNDSVLSAVSRVFRDDWKKSIELSTNIVYIFFCLSTFSQFHAIIAHYKVGSLCMQVIEHEIKRYDSLNEEVEKKKKRVKMDPDNAEIKKDAERSRKKLLTLVKKQEILLRVAFYLLLNIAEDTRVELKMRNKNLIPMLVKMLERSNEELLILIVSFLKKLSIFSENKDDMEKLGIIKKLSRIVPTKNETLMNVTLRLLLNLSFDPGLRDQMVKEGYLPKYVSLLKNDSHRVVVLCILYHISMSEKCSTLFSYTDCIPILMKLILESQEDWVQQELVSVGINLSCDEQNVKLMVKGPGLKLLMKRALQTQDALLMKMIKNISQHKDKEIKKLFLDFVSPLGEVINSSIDCELVTEATNILANINLPDLDFNRLATKYQLIPFIIKKYDASEMALPPDDDLMLAIMRLTATLSLDKNCALQLLHVNITDKLLNELKSRQEDDEAVLCIVCAFCQLITHEDVRLAIAKDTQVSEYLLELMNDKNKEVAKMSGKALDILSECDPQLAMKVQHERFKWHNFQWLEMTTGQAIVDDLDPYYEDYNDSYQFPEDLNDVYDVLDMHSPLSSHYHVEQSFQEFSGPEEYYTAHLYNSVCIGEDNSYMPMQAMNAAHPLARTI